MTIRVYREADRQTLKEITAVYFDGVCIDQNIENRFGPIDGKNWQWRKVRHIDADVAANASGIFVAEFGECVAGYITTRIDRESRIDAIPNIAVLPEFQGKGIGKALMRRALDYLREQGMVLAKIETLDQNQIGSTFYPQTGFCEVARQIHYIMPLEPG
ncbi:MAG: GNAT family N-acetyltransferase [candidate division Zixibacteria bacterium]|nr:GNAT family N-acetyltransferase [candidate division Zixibacteria bacterium]